MIRYALDPETSILQLSPVAALEQEDFIALAKIVDAHLGQSGRLKGVLVEITDFPGWASFSALVEHLRFVHDHHRRIGKIGIVTDALIGNVAEKLGSHFVAADIRHFPAGESTAARQWLAS
ncbi:MAG: STAS/SEC14 domain-containing protein [Moraxellaceae bacterium]